MRHVAPAVAVLALLAAACARDLALPPENRLAVEPAIGNVAPRERVVLTITGGSGSASIRFAEGSPHSGADATVDPVTLTYQSGSAGSAEDVIEVVDGAGGVATARITVGPRLAVSPPMGVVAPGGTVALVGSGGRPPYAFRMEAAPSGGAVGDDGVYVAGAVGDLVDVVVVSDATLDPAAEVRAQLRVTSALRIYPAQASLAPAETLAFVGLGGQPGYAFSVVSSTGGASTPAASTPPAGAAAPRGRSTP